VLALVFAALLVVLGNIYENFSVLENFGIFPWKHP
jgi:hypothetical protein